MLKIEAAAAGDKFVVKIIGKIDEEAKLEELKPTAGLAVAVDFGEVTGINSWGVREWIKWLGTLAPGAKLSYARCPKVVVDQMNQVSGFLRPGTVVESFKVPYFCEICETTTDALLVRGKDYADGKITPPKSVPCASCQDATALDVLEAKYFKFIPTQK